MDNIKAAIRILQDSVSAENRKRKGVEDALMQLQSTVNLLKLSTVPPNTFKRLSELLRQRLLPLYQVSLTRTLQYSIAVLEFIQDDKLMPALDVKDEPLKHVWEQLLTSLVSGVLDYLDQNPDAHSRDSIASVLYPILSRIYLSPLAKFLSEFDGGLLSAVYQLLVTTVEPQARNAVRLRDHGISSKRLGLTLSRIRDFLAIESLLDIICTLIPPIKSGLGKRSQFIKEVFDPDLFQCSKSILQILESITDGDWSITAVKIIEALANSDISFPQPFDASSLMICGISVNSLAPFYVDKNGFLANLDQDGKVETLYIPFHTVTRIVASSTNNVEISIVLILTIPPIIGTESLSVPSGRQLSVSWHLKKSQLDKFIDAAKNRNLIFLNSTTRKLSLPGTHIAFNLPADKQPQELISTQEKIQDMAKFLATPFSPGDHAESTSPIHQESDCFSSHKRQAENISQSAKLVTAIVEDDAGHPALSIFLDRSGKLIPPSQPTNEPSIEQSLVNNTLLAISSTSELPQHPVQQSTRNPDDVEVITSGVTHSNNVNLQIVQKPPIGKAKKKPAPTKKPLAVKRHANLPILQTKALDAQFHSVISTDPIDMDKISESNQTVPVSKTRKRGSATTVKEVTKPLDEQRQFEDNNVDLKPKNKKRSSPNKEDSEAAHVSDQEPPTKRARVDSEQPSHLSLPYQRKKYGRNGKTTSPRAESPAVPTVDFDEIPELKPTRAVKQPKSRVSARRTKSKPAVFPKKKQEYQDVKVDVLPTPDVPVSLAKAKKDNRAGESLSEIDHHPLEQQTTTNPGVKPDRHTTSFTKSPSTRRGITAQVHNENNATKKPQTAPWENKSFLQKAEGSLDSIPSTKETLIQNNETSDHDHSLTLLVDDDDYKIEPSTFVPDIVMIDLTQDSPKPAKIPNRVLLKSSLKEDKPVANVQPAPPAKQTQKVEVEILSPYALPTKNRHDRPSVSFALPIQPQRHQWTETPTLTRKQRTNLGSNSHKIRRRWEKLDHNPRSVHQQAYAKVEKNRYEPPEEPIERIAEIIQQINETVVHQISRRFDSVREEVHAGRRRILQGTLERLESMHEESVAHVANMEQLKEEYALRCGDILKGSEDFLESAKNVSICLGNIVKHHSQQSLCKKFPPTLFGKRTGILLDATIR